MNPVKQALLYTTDYTSKEERV